MAFPGASNRGKLIIAESIEYLDVIDDNLFTKKIYVDASPHTFLFAHTLPVIARTTPTDKSSKSVGARMVVIDTCSPIWEEDGDGTLLYEPGIYLYDEDTGFIHSDFADKLDWYDGNDEEPNRWKKGYYYAVRGMEDLYYGGQTIVRVGNYEIPLRAI